MGAVVWLASYPKSGNTWMRALLAGVLGPDALDEDGLDLNRLGHRGHPGGLRTLGTLLGVEPALLRPDELQRYQPAAARILARGLADAPEAPPVVVCKVHSANLVTATGDRLFPPDAGRALYVVRNPLDVTASLAPFFGITAEQAVARLADAAFVLNPRQRGHTALAPEPLRSWSAHVRSWLDAPGLALHVVRYEDLHADPAGTLAAALRFLGVEAGPDRVAAAVAAARFDRLRAREAAEGFREHPTRAVAPFFRKGRTGTWREELTPAQARRVAADHEAVMRRLGYGALVDEVAALHA